MKKPPQEVYGISIRVLQEICHISAKTAARWKDGTTRPPATALMILRIKVHGDLAELGPEWTGWHYRGGELTSPDGWRINRNDALSVPLMHGQIDALRQKISALEASPDVGLEEQPLPGDIPAILAG